MKRNYIYEEMNKIPVILMLGMSLLILISGIMGFKQLRKESVPIGITILVELVCFGIAIGLVYISYRYIQKASINQKEAKEIIENGIKVKGKIIDTKTEIKAYNEVRDGNTYVVYKKYYSFIVEYINNGNKYEVKTPSVNFHPDYLISKEVDVYLYGSRFYVDNFVLDVEKMVSNKKKNIKINLIVAFHVILLIIINAIIIFLAVKGIIPYKLAKKFTIISLGISVVIVIIANIIHLFKKWYLYQASRKAKQSFINKYYGDDIEVISIASQELKVNGVKIIQKLNDCKLEEILFIYDRQDVIDILRNNGINSILVNNNIES